VAARYSVHVNGFHAIALTRLDTLTGFNPLRICVGYQLDGKRVDHFPARAELLARCTPIYEDFEGWDESIAAARSLDALPDAARRYVGRLEELLDVPAALVGVGQEREQTIVVQDLL
jgi:adenylosuccinate synthase